VIPAWLARLGALVRNRAVDHEFDEEIRTHIEMATEEYLRQGLSPAAAARAARRDFGGVDQVKQRHREARGLAWIDGVRGDLAIGVRRLMGRPSFTLAAVTTLGLGVGATTAMFSAVDTILLQPLPYASADDVLVLRQSAVRDGTVREGVSLANALDVAEASRTLAFAGAAEGPHGLRLFEDGRASSLRAWLVSEGFLDAMGADVVLGRAFLPSEFAAGNDRVVLLGHALWQNRYGSDREIVGRQVVLDDAPHTVVGVLAEGFAYPTTADIWAPRAIHAADLGSRGRQRAGAMGVVRLAPGIGTEEAQTELDRIAAELRVRHPEANDGVAFHLTPLREYLFGDIRAPIVMLFGAVLLVLLIAAANVAGLQAAWGSSRAREYALRGALGASRRRLVRLVCVESSIVGAMGGLLGVALAYVGVDVIRGLAPDGIPRIEALRVDGSALTFALVVAVGSALAAGIAPSIRAAREQPRSALDEASRGSTVGRGTVVLRDRLVVGEIALALVLAVGAGLLVQSFDRLRRNELGFDPGRRLAAQVWAYGADHHPDLNFFAAAVEELRQTPGVEAVGLTTDLPLANDRTVLSRSVALDYVLDGGDALPTGDSRGGDAVIGYAAIDPGYLDAMGIPVTQGRGFNELDAPESEPVALVNEAFVRRHFLAREAVGRRITLQGEPGRIGESPREIVGVVSDVRRQGHASMPAPEVYVPLAQAPANGLTFVVRTTDKAEVMIPTVQEALWRVDPNQAVWAMRPMTDLLGDWTRQRRFNTALLVAFAVLALALASVGVYGLVAFGVEQRAGELAIRRAMGGRRSDVLRMVLGRGLALAGTGVGLGLAGAIGFAMLIRGMLYGVAPLDALTFIGVAAVVVVTTVAATIRPALRATRIEPMAALRVE
jgi:putative ABC transport system permease protein